MAVRFAPEHPLHGPAIERLLDAAFGPGRHAKSSARVREGAWPEPRLSRVGLSGRRVVACCRISQVVPAGGAPVLFLGPLAVDPALQNGGVGAKIVDATLAACRASRFGCVILVGRPQFFSRFGFAAIPQDVVRLERPTDPARLQWLALKPGGCAGVAGVLGG